MAEGLEFLVELDAKLDGALEFERVLKGIDKGIGAVDSGLKKVEHASGRASAGHEKHGKAAKHTEGILHHFLDATLGPFAHKLKEIAEFEFIRRGVDALIDAPKEAFEWFKELFGEMVKVASQAERTSKSFELLMGPSEGREMLEWTEKVSKFTEFTGAQLKGMEQSLAKVGFKGEGLKDAVAAALDLAGFSGSGQEGAESAISALNMLKVSGKVGPRQLKGFGISDEDFWKELSDRTGIGIQSLKKRIDEGKLDTQESIDALLSLVTKRTGKDLGGVGFEMSKTMGAQMTHLKAAPEEMFEKMADTKGFAALKGFTTRLNQALDPESASGGKLLATLAKTVDMIGAMVSKIDVNVLVKDITRLVTIFDHLLVDLDRFTGVRNPVSGKVEFPKATTGVSGAIEKGWDFFRWITPKKIQPGPMVHDWFGKKLDSWDKAGEDAAAGMAKGVEGGIPDVAAATDAMGKAAIDATKTKIDAHSPSRVFEDLGKMTGAGFNRGIEASMARTDDVVRGAFAVPAPRGGNLGGNHTISVEVNTTVNAAGAPHEIAQQVTQQIREIIPGALQSAIEQMAGQAGSA